MSRPNDNRLREYYLAFHKAKTPIGDAIDLANWAMDQALEGMIPAANVIQAPDESEWHYDTEAIETYEITRSGKAHILVNRIERSKPQYVPNDDEDYVWWESGVSDNNQPNFSWLSPTTGISGIDCHAAMIKSIHDIGHDIAWFKANRPWI